MRRKRFIELKMKIIFFGTPSFIAPVEETLRQHFDLVGVMRAADEKITVEQLKQLQPDLFVVAAYGKILPQEILDIPKFGALNIHPSLLPKYRGPSPVQTTILNGDKTTGITIIKMDSEMDHGPIVFQEKIELKGDETSESLLKCVFEKAADIFPNIINEYINGSIQLIQQNDKDATYCQQITKQDGFFDINNPPSPEKLDRMIRAYYPWPGVWTRLRQDFGGQSKTRDKIVKFLPEKKLQVEGKKPQSLKDFLNGYPELRKNIIKLFEV